jgi:hypothetical protein
MTKSVLVALRQWATALAIACAFATLPAVARSAGIAMVTDLQGNASASGDRGSASLTILTELQAGTRAKLEAGATLVVLYLNSGEEYVFKGPATIAFGPSEPEVLSGQRPEKRSALGNAAKDVRIKPVGMAQAAIVMRGVRTSAGIQLLNLHQTSTLETQPEFRWQALQPGVKYGFRLSDGAGRTVFETTVGADSFKLPANVQIKEGVPYTWEVSAKLDGRKYASSADFVIAPANVRASAKALRPADTAPLSSKVVYATWLEEMELKDEARKYWRAAAAERPEDPRLKALAER